MPIHVPSEAIVLAMDVHKNSICRLISGSTTRAGCVPVTRRARRLRARPPPSLIPTAPGQRVKTDKRDARRLEAVQDLCWARADLVNWTDNPHAWIDRQRFNERAATVTFESLPGRALGP